MIWIQHHPLGPQHVDSLSVTSNVSRKKKLRRNPCTEVAEPDHTVIRTSSEFRVQVPKVRIPFTIGFPLGNVVPVVGRQPFVVGHADLNQKRECTPSETIVALSFSTWAQQASSTGDTAQSKRSEALAEWDGFRNAIEDRGRLKPSTVEVIELGERIRQGSIDTGCTLHLCLILRVMREKVDHGISI